MGRSSEQLLIIYISESLSNKYKFTFGYLCSSRKQRNVCFLKPHVKMSASHGLRRTDTAFASDLLNIPLNRTHWTLARLSLSVRSAHQWGWRICSTLIKPRICFAPNKLINTHICRMRVWSCKNLARTGSLCLDWDRKPWERLGEDFITSSHRPRRVRMIELF